MKLLPTQNPDVLVCDLRMPAAPGFEPSIVASLAAACKCVVVAISFAEIDSEMEARARNLGASEVLDKTKLYELLAPAIRKAVQTGTSSATV
jgi:DNA-binding NarL/FixJ family response regulator